MVLNQFQVITNGVCYFDKLNELSIYFIDQL